MDGEYQECLFPPGLMVTIFGSPTLYLYLGPDQAVVEESFVWNQDTGILVVENKNIKQASIDAQLLINWRIKDDPNHGG